MLHFSWLHDFGALAFRPYELTFIERAARALFWPTPDDQAKEAQAALDRVASKYPVTMEALLEAKTCVALGCLPGPGGLEDQTGGFPQLMRFLAARGIVEGLTRGSIG